MLRTWKDVVAAQPNSAESQLIEDCMAGKRCVLGDGECPAPASSARLIRAEVLRYLILGGCSERRIHERGVFLTGAVVEGTLDIDFCTITGAICFEACRFEEPIAAEVSKIAYIAFEDCVLSGVDLAYAHIYGALSFFNSRMKNGCLSLYCAVVEGSASFESTILDCDDSSWRGESYFSINAQGVRVNGSVFLNGARVLGGIVSFSGAHVAEQFECDGAELIQKDGVSLDLSNVEIGGDLYLRCNFVADAGVIMPGANIAGQVSFERSVLSCGLKALSSDRAFALDARRMRVGQQWVWQAVAIHQGFVDLSSASVGDLVDDEMSWPDGRADFFLDGFVYEQISASFTDTKKRLRWLGRGALRKGEFHPQAYAQLAKTYRLMGHFSAARRVHIARRRLTALHDWRRNHRALDGTWRPAARSLAADFGQVLSWLSRSVVGYGYAPFRSLGWLVGLWVIASVMAHFAWENGAMAPNSDVIITSDEWGSTAGADDGPARWASDAGRDWATFSPVLWAFDVVVPIIDVGQTSAWSPSYERGAWGRVSYWGQWMFAVAGWVVAALAAAAVTGTIRHEDS